MWSYLNKNLIKIHGSRDLVVVKNIKALPPRFIRIMLIWIETWLRFMVEGMKLLGTTGPLLPPRFIEVGVSLLNVIWHVRGHVHIFSIILFISFKIIVPKPFFKISSGKLLGSLRRLQWFQILQQQLMWLGIDLGTPKSMYVFIIL